MTKSNNKEDKKNPAPNGRRIAEIYASGAPAVTLSKRDVNRFALLQQSQEKNNGKDTDTDTVMDAAQKKKLELTNHPGTDPVVMQEF